MRSRRTPSTLPGLVSSHILDGCGHWIQQERPAETNKLLTDWLAGLPEVVPEGRRGES